MGEEESDDANDSYGLARTIGLGGERSGMVLDEM